MTDNPLTGPPPAEVPLASAPLMRVIAQVRFPLVASLESPDAVAPFQEAIRGEYGILRQEAAPRFSVQISGQADVELKTHTVWRFTDMDQRWRVSLAPDFLALETRRYTSRDEFIGRLETLLRVLEEHVRPAAVDRIGVRYIDRVTSPDVLEKLGTFVRPALLGVLATPAAAGSLIAVSEAVFELPEEHGRMHARWGLVPPQTTLDPAAVEPIPETSWVLDLDAFQDGEERAFASRDIASAAHALAVRAYAFFRWSVTDAFLKRFGGEP